MRMTIRSWRFSGRQRRPAGLAAAVAMLVTAGLVAGWQPPAKAASHPRLSGLQVVRNQYPGNLRDLSPVKTATVPCPPGKRVLGGGGWIRFGGIEPDGRLPVTLTRLQPYQPWQNADDQQGYGFRVDAAALTAGPTHPWGLEAWAYCANASSVPGIHVVTYSSGWSSAPVQATTAPCPDGQQVLGTGARVEPYYYGDSYQRGLGLQVARPDGLGLLARAQAHEQPDGYPYDWRIQAIAVCTPNTPVGYVLAGAASPQRGSESFKDAYGTCPDLPDNLPRLPISVGGAVSNVAPGNATLEGTGPFDIGNGNGEVFAYANENTPTPLPWDFIVVSYVCALFGAYVP
jgi:hypothetical protein